MKKLLVITLLTLSSSLLTLRAQYNVLHYFNDTLGASPQGSLTFSGKAFYGMTASGGANNKGCVFCIDTTGVGYKDIFDFNGINGAFPLGSLTLLGSRLYGMTYNGGANDSGCIFSINTTGGGYKDMFDFNFASGYYPDNCSLIYVSGMLYGVTTYGGIGFGSGNGCIFRIDTNGNGFSILHYFNGVNGLNPNGSLAYASGVLYGMTQYGGTNGDVFSIDTNGTGYKDLFDFDGANGRMPHEGFTLSGDVLYGTTQAGGVDSDGLIFSINTNGSGYKDLLDFNGANGSIPYGALIFSGGTLYGMTSEGGLNSFGCIFSIDTNGGGYKDLYNFNCPTGCAPFAALTLSGNNLYGMTWAGGIYNDVGVIFSLNFKTAGINELNTSSAVVNLFPNPNNGKFTLEVKCEEQGVKSDVEVYNMLGEKVYSTPFSTFNSQLSIDLPCKSAGVYLYRVISETGAFISEGKFVME